MVNDVAKLNITYLKLCANDGRYSFFFFFFLARNLCSHVTLSKMTHFTLVIQVTENQALVVLQSQKVMLPVSNPVIDVNS